MKQRKVERLKLAITSTNVTTCRSRVGLLTPRYTLIFFLFNGQRGLKSLVCRWLILVPRDRVPFGQHQESWPLGRSSEILVRNGFVNKKDWDQNQSDLSDLTLNMHRVMGSPWIADFWCWIFPEVVILGADQKEHGLCGQEWATYKPSYSRTSRPVKSGKSDWFWSQSIVFRKPFRTGISLDLSRGYNSWCWPKGVWSLGKRIKVAELSQMVCNFKSIAMFSFLIHSTSALASTWHLASGKCTSLSAHRQTRIFTVAQLFIDINKIQW